MCHLECIYGILNISEKFDDLNKMENTSPESKVELEIPGKGLVTSLALKTKAKLKKYKKARYAIENVSMKYLSKKIKEFEKLSRYLMSKGSPNMNPLRVIFM